VVFDAGLAASADEVVDGVRELIAAETADADGRLVACRVSVVGASRAHATLSLDAERFQNELRSAALDVGRDAVWVEKIVVGTRPEGDPRLLRARNDPVGALLRALDTLRHDEDQLGRLLDELKDLKRKLPRELLDGPDGARIASVAGLGALVEDIEGLLLPLLSEEGKES
jgi:hypothetical protein